MRVHHVAFRTDDLERLERFYVDVLGFTVTRRTESVWLDAGGTILMLERRDESEPEVPPSTKELVAFEVTPDVGIEARLAAAGIPVEDRTKYTLYLRDPDGRRIGLSAYPNELG